MAEESINEVITRAKARALHSQHYGLPSDKEDVLALIAEVLRLSTFDNWSVMDRERMQAELETMRAEKLDVLVIVSVLQGVLGRVMELANDGKVYETLMAKDIAFDAIKDVINTYAALNTQPQAEWTPRRLVPTVRVKRDAFDADNRRGQVGVIVGSAADYFEIEFEDGITEGVKRSEVEPLTE